MSEIGLGRTLRFKLVELKFVKFWGIKTSWLNSTVISPLDVIKIIFAVNCEEALWICIWPAVTVRTQGDNEPLILLLSAAVAISIIKYVFASLRFVVSILN